MENLERKNEEEDNEDFTSKIMPYEKYAEIEVEKSYSEEPYIFEVKIGDCLVTYVGVGHSNDPESGMYEKIDELFKEKQPDLVLVEGLDNFEQRKEVLYKQLEGRNKKEIIQLAGEPRYVLSRAVEFGINADSPEPKFSEEIMHLLEKGFSREAVFVFDMTRMLEQYHRKVLQGGSQDDIEDYFDRNVKTFAMDAGWEDFDWSFENYKKLYSELLGKKFDEANQEILHDFVDPVPWKGKDLAITNRVADESSLYRDAHIVKEIAEKAKTYQRILMVFGATHAIMQEPALRYLAENSRT